MAHRTRIDLLRHGEPIGGYRFRGQSDDPLSERGWAQMWSAVGEHCPWQGVLTSPLSRCSAFAAALAAHHRVGLHEEPRLKERAYGPWERRAPDEIELEDPGVVARMKRDPLGLVPDGAEPLPVLQARIVEVLEELCAQHPGGHLLLVVHAGVIRAVLCHLLGAPLESFFRFRVPYACLTRIELGGADPLPQLLFHAGRP